MWSWFLSYKIISSTLLVYFWTIHLCNLFLNYFWYKRVSTILFHCEFFFVSNKYHKPSCIILIWIIKNWKKTELKIYWRRFWKISVKGNITKNNTITSTKISSNQNNQILAIDTPTNSIKVVIIGNHRSIVRDYKGLIRWVCRIKGTIIIITSLHC